MRPLIHDFQNDPTVRQLDDQFMFGNDLLVAPVFAIRVQTRVLYLPEGEWYDWNSQQFNKGKNWISINAPIDQLPVCEVWKCHSHAF